VRRFGLYPDLASLGDWVTLGAPEQVDPDDWVYLGNLSEFGPKSRVRFAVGDEKVIAIFGKRGQGKSFTLGCLLEGLTLGAPDPSLAAISAPRAVLLLDPLNIFQWIDIALTEDVAGVSSELGAQVQRAGQFARFADPIQHHFGAIGELVSVDGLVRRLRTGGQQQCQRGQPAHAGLLASVVRNRAHPSIPLADRAQRDTSRLKIDRYADLSASVVDSFVAVNITASLSASRGRGRCSGKIKCRINKSAGN